MQSSSQYDHSSRPTLPPIRDLFRDELARRPSLHDSPSIALAKLRVSDEDANEVSSQSHITSRPVYRSGHFDSTIGSGHRSTSHREPPPMQRYESEYYVLSGGNSSPFLREAPLIRVSPISDHNDLPRSKGAHETPNHGQPRHRHTVPQPYDYRDSAGLRYSYTNSPSTLPPHRSGKTLSSSPPAPWNISTSVPKSNIIEDDERTPVARLGSDATRTAPSIVNSTEDSGSASKYECTYCGKGFNRPSSLKIHLNSHTGEKPFVCPVQSCGRSFSVLSNMRRHTRVHATVPLSDSHSNDDVPSSSTTSESFSRRWHRRRDSSVSTSSSRSNSISTDEE